MPRLRPAASQTPSAEEQKKAAVIAAAAEAKRLKELEEKGDLEGAELEPQDDEIDAAAGDEGEEQDTVNVLKKQIEDLKKSEQIQRDLAQQAMRDREEALRRSREREAEASTIKKQAGQDKLDAINSGIAAAKAEAAAAERDIENAVQLGDIKAQSDAYRRLARAEANLGKLEDGKAEAEAALKADATAAERRSDDPIERMEAPDTIKNWLRAHPDYLTDQRKNAKLQALHWDVLDEGHAFGSQAYIESMETHLGLRKKPDPVVSRAEEDDDEEDGKRRGSMVSAPVSREARSSNGQRINGTVRLTAAQREAAKMAGITETEYAKQLQNLEKMRANGEYDEAR